jgi:hypothetical protein
VSFYVRRTREGRTGWTGPIRSPHQADREAAAWFLMGYLVEVVPSSPAVRKDVRDWERAKRIDNAMRSTAHRGPARAVRDARRYTPNC